MSHFSKIKTSITNIEVLKTTIEDLGLKYESFDSDEYFSFYTNQNLIVYDLCINHNKVPLITFEWSINKYIMIVDLELWSLDIDFDYFTDRLFQQYAYNVVISRGSSGGFYKLQEDFIEDGSIKVIFQKF